MYPLIRSIFFRFPPEEAHHIAMKMLQTATSIPIVNNIMASHFNIDKPSLKKTVFGLEFTNPVGIGAGFDKNAQYIKELKTLGFGFVEIGTVTPLAQPGNDKPRVFRLPADKALINRMGFNNEGCEIIAERLIKLRNKEKNLPIIGANIGKNKVTPNEDAWKDYVKCLNGLYESSDYFVVNVSSPNTPGLRALQEKDALQQILSSLINEIQKKNIRKPLLLKIAPDLTPSQVDDVIDLSLSLPLDGLVVSNTTIERQPLPNTLKVKVEEMGAGGLSGKPLLEKSNKMLQYISKGTKGTIPIIGSGGIFTGEDAQQKLDAGASLIQVWTGFIYEGPAIARKINKYLLR